MGLPRSIFRPPPRPDNGIGVATLFRLGFVHGRGAQSKNIPWKKLPEGKKYRRRF